MSSPVTQRRQPDTFTSFPKLPTEPQLMIWELALDRPRHIVHVYPFKDDTDPRPSKRRDSKRAGRKRKRQGHVEGMQRVQGEEIMKKNTKGPFESHFDNLLTARLTSVLNAGIIHLVRVPYPLDEIATMGIKPGKTLTEKVGRAIKSENIFLIDIKRPLHRMSVRLAVWRFVDWFAPLGRVFLVDYGLKRSEPIEEPGASVPDVIFEEDRRRFVKVRKDGAGWENDFPGQGNQRVRYLIPDGYRSRFHIAACEYV